VKPAYFLRKEYGTIEDFKTISNDRWELEGYIIDLNYLINSGLISIKLGRKRINRVLFVTPANLREQWQTILKKFFGIDAVIMSRRNRRKLESELLVGGNPWGYYNF